MTTIIRDIKVLIARQRIYHRLGLEKNKGLTQRLSAAIDEQMEKVPELIEPLAGYSIQPITSIKDSNISVGISTLKSGILAKVLSNCRYIAIYLITIGSKLERKVTQLSNEGLTLEAYVLDTIGSAALDGIMDSLTDKIRTIAAADGNKITYSFNPGQIDWDITQQKIIFNLIDAQSLGVKLNKASMMIPLQSISGVFGIGRLKKNQDRITPCRFCDKANCPSRREAFMKQVKWD